MERVRARLEKLQRRVAKGRIKAAEKIGAAAARILARNHGHRYYDWSCSPQKMPAIAGCFNFSRSPIVALKVTTEKQRTPPAPA
jgi:hypothetical protein